MLTLNFPAPSDLVLQTLSLVTKEHRFGSISDYSLRETRTVFVEYSGVFFFFFKKKINQENDKDSKADLNESHCKKSDMVNFRVHTEVPAAWQSQLETMIESMQVLGVLLIDASMLESLVLKDFQFER